ncbi:MAG: acyl-CoA-binding protein [Myxococcota bacterium]
MATQEEFDSAVTAVKGLPKTPDNQSLLDLYAAFKQATVGDVSGKRPGMLDVKGRAKYDAWAKLKGTSTEDARSKYVAKVRALGA